MDYNLVGCIAEYKFAVEAMKRGISVSFPLLNTSPYDCIIESQNGLFKVQVKSLRSDTVEKRVYLRHKYNKSYNRCDVDYFAVFDEAKDGFYIFKYDEVGMCVTLYNKKYSKNFNNFAIL